ncbi:hypothetical protein [Nocardioides nanhaiensis]
MTSPLRESLRSRLLRARRERDTAAVSALRTAIAAVENAEAVPIPAAGPVTEVDRRVLGADEERRLVGDEAADLRLAERDHRSRGDQQRALVAAAGAEVLEQVLAQAPPSASGGRTSA